jgi:hypothetical protein
MSALLYSDISPVIAWSEVEATKLIYGPKGAGLAALPRAWTPPFALIPAVLTTGLADSLGPLGSDFPRKVLEIGGPSRTVIVRSSVLGETIWDRGKYVSQVVTLDPDDWEKNLLVALHGDFDRLGLGSE